MKTKLLSVSILVFAAVFGTAQKVVKMTSDHYKQLPGNLKNLPQESSDRFKRLNATYKTTATESFWVNYGEAKDVLNPGVASFGDTYLFPDSTVKAEFGDGSGGTTLDYTWIHSVGNVLDVKSQVYKDAYNMDWNKHVAYTVDSMSILYGYIRNHPDANIVDTLIVYLYSNSTASNLVTGSFNTLSGYDDVVYFKTQNYTFTTNKPSASGITTIKIPLTIADTAEALLRFKNFSTIVPPATTPFTVPANKLVACGISFKPGYSYSTGDTLTLNKNYLRVRSWEENGNSTLPGYTYCNPTPNEDACDWNCSGTVTKYIRYNVTSQANGWEGTYIPTYAWATAWSLEHHYILYKVTANFEAGLNELDFQNGIKLGQNFPNPLTNSTTIKYEITGNANVSLAIYDITGKRVMNFNQGKQPAGVHSINIDTANLQSGVYFYTLTAGDGKITKKMTVVE